MKLDSYINLYSRDLVGIMREHKCGLCDKMITEGPAHYLSGKVNKTFVSEWHHPDCWANYLKSGRIPSIGTTAAWIVRILESEG